jgi:hypothetical protein
MELSLPAITITPEIQAALQASGGDPIHVQDPETLRVYTITQQPIEVTLDDEYIRQGLQVARDQFSRSEFSEWDVQATIAEAKRRYVERPNA